VPLPQAWEFVGYDGAGTQVAQLDLVSCTAVPHRIHSSRWRLNLAPAPS